jgi:hypothetical protein
MHRNWNRLTTRIRQFIQRIMILKTEIIAKWCLAAFIAATLGAAASSDFLQALVYHRIAAAKTDMTALAMALESYRIDHLKYPNDVENGWPWYPTYQLTTPIPYVSSELFFDPFRSEYQPYTYSRYFFYYRYINYEANLENWGGLGPNYIGWRPSVSEAECLAGMAKYGGWKLLSVAPDGNVNIDYVQYFFFSNSLLYDPTNGTVSAGDIVISQKTTE